VFTEVVLKGIDVASDLQEVQRLIVLYIAMSEELIVYKMSSSEDVAEFGDILWISSTEPPD
jgi:hypothetical protein